MVKRDFQKNVKLTGYPMQNALKTITRPPKDVLLFGLVVILSLITFSVLTKSPLEIGTDADNRMRLVQIMEYLAQGRWFDVGQSRLGLDGDTAMHWSRIVDAPILALHWVFALVVSDELALSLACAVWPPLSVGLVVYGIALGMGTLSGKYTRAFIFLIAFTVLYRHHRFMPGGIDHHNLQLGCLAIALGATLRVHKSWIYPAMAATAVSVSVVIGAEVYAFIAGLCAFYAVDWALRGDEVKRAVQVFGGALFGSLLVLYPAFVAPELYLSKSCDALSSVPLLAVAIGGVGLAILAQFASGLSQIMRVCSIMLFAALCLIVLNLYAPLCLHDPMADLSPTVRILWLGQIGEARPVYAVSADMWQRIPYMMGIILTAILVCAYKIWKGSRVRFHSLSLVLLLISGVLSVIQNRFHVFGHLFAILPLGLWCGELFFMSRKDDGGGLGYVGAVAASISFVWAVPGLILVDTAPAVQVQMNSVEEACQGPEAMSALRELPNGRVLATPDLAPHLLQYTAHNVLTGNYHRYQSGIEAAIYIALSDEADEQRLLAEAGVDYILFCKGVANTQRLIMEAPTGLYGRMADKAAPSLLSVEAQSDASDSWVIYSVGER